MRITSSNQNDTFDQETQSYNNQSIGNSKIEQNSSSEITQKIDHIVNLTAKKFGIDESKKCTRVTNNYYLDYKLNLQHSKLICMRKMSLNFFTIKNLILNLIFILIPVVVGISSMLYSKNEEQSDPKSAKIELESAFLRIMFHQLALLYLSICSVMAGSAFFIEKQQIKREIGVSTYSLSSYYLGTFLFEMSRVFIAYISVIFLTIYLSFKFSLTSSSVIEQIILFTLTFIGAIVLFLFCDSIAMSKRLSALFVDISLFLNGFVQLVHLLTSLLLNIKYPYGILLCNLLNVFPTYTLSNLNFSKLSKSAIKNFENSEQYEKNNLNYSEPAFLPNLQEYTSTKKFLFFETSPNFGYLVAGLVISLHVVMAIYLLGWNLRPSSRMVLNRKCIFTGNKVKVLKFLYFRYKYVKFYKFDLSFSSQNIYETFLNIFLSKILYSSVKYHVFHSGCSNL